MLVAEDDESVRSTLAEVLHMWGFDSIAAPDGQAALELLQGGATPCVILLDWVMPRMGGEAFLEAHLASTAEPRVPVYVMSASHQHPQVPGLEGFLEKPFSVPALEAALRDVCLRCPASRREARGCGERGCGEVRAS